jgi:serine/threonine-protein kinase
MPPARDAALRALALDPEMDSAHVTLGTVRLLFDWDWPAAEREFRRALEINPNSAAAHLGYGTYLATLGRVDEAIDRVQQAYRFDPVAVESRAEALWIYYYSGRMADTIEQCERMIELEPAAGLPYAILALARAHLGQRTEALAAADQAVQLANSPTITTTAASALARSGQRAEAKRGLDQSLAVARERYVCRFIVAAAYVDLGETERAFEALEQAYLQRSG